MFPKIVEIFCRQTFGCRRDSSSLSAEDSKNVFFRPSSIRWFNEDRRGCWKKRRQERWFFDLQKCHVRFCWPLQKSCHADLTMASTALGASDWRVGGMKRTCQEGPPSLLTFDSYCWTSTFRCFVSLSAKNSWKIISLFWRWGTLSATNKSMFLQENAKCLCQIFAYVGSTRLGWSCFVLHAT